MPAGPFHWVTCIANDRMLIAPTVRPGVAMDNANVQSVRAIGWSLISFEALL